MTIETIKFEKGFNEILDSVKETPSFTDEKPKFHSYPSISGDNNSSYYDCCDNPKILVHRGVYVCTNCAIVHEPTMVFDYSNLMDSTAHVEKKWNYPYQDHGCRTVFSLENLSPKKRFQFWRLAKLNKHFNNSTEANMKLANQVLYKVASQLEIPNSAYRYALKIYKKAIDMRLTVGRGINNLMVACLYISCNINQFSRNIEDFSRITQIPVKNIRKYYRLILERFNIKLKRFSAAHYVSKFSIALGLSVQFQSYVKQLIEVLLTKRININSNPKGFASAAIYLIAKKVFKEKSIKQKTLSDLSKISEVTIRKYIKVLNTHVNLPNFITEISISTPILTEPVET